MARPPKFTVDELLDGALDVVQEHWRSSTIAHVSQVVGAPVGSIYHRFGSRDELFAALWLRSVRRFHERVLSVSAVDDPQEALEASALSVPRFCREHPADAKAMTLFRREDLIARQLTPLHDDLVHVNDRIDAALADLTTRRWGEATPERLFRAMVACRLGPYGLVRPWVGDAVPPELDDMVLASARGILALEG